MADINSELGWSDAQWEKVNNAVMEAFEKASIAAAFLPCYGPLPGSAEYVRKETLSSSIPSKGEKLTVTVTDDTTLKLLNLTVHVTLSSEQVADEALSSALLAFRRAAIKLAQVEDHLIFNGRGSDQVAALLPGSPDIPNVGQDSVVVSGEPALKGLINTQTAPQIVASAASKASLQTAQQTELQNALQTLQTALQTSNLREPAQQPSAKHPSAEPPPAPQPPAQQPVQIVIMMGTNLSQSPNVDGKHLVAAVANAVVALERDSHPGPFGCILGANAFVAAHTPETGGMVLPADRITPILNGPLLRSGVMPPNVGIVVSLAGSNIDLVVATPPKAQFLQMSPDAKFLFRVYEKIMFRIKDDAAAQGISV